MIFRFGLDSNYRYLSYIKIPFLTKETGSCIAFAVSTVIETKSFWLHKIIQPICTACGNRNQWLPLEVIENISKTTLDNLESRLPSEILSKFNNTTCSSSNFMKLLLLQLISTH